MLGNLHDLNKFTEKTLPERNVVMSNLIIRTDNDKASLTVIKTK